VGAAALEISVDGGDDRALLRLEGELDLASAERLEDALRGAEAGRPELLVIDLRGLAFIDSSGLRLLLMAGERARKDGRRLIVVRGPSEVDRIFEITGADQQLELVSEPPAVK
jgi:anti-anti-sigma factor